MRIPEIKNSYLALAWAAIDVAFAAYSGTTAQWAAPILIASLFLREMEYHKGADHD